MRTRIIINDGKLKMQSVNMLVIRTDKGVCIQCTCKNAFLYLSSCRIDIIPKGSSVKIHEKLVLQQNFPHIIVSVKDVFEIMMRRCHSYKSNTTNVYQNLEVWYPSACNK